MLRSACSSSSSAISALLSVRACFLFLLFAGFAWTLGLCALVMINKAQQINQPLVAATVRGQHTLANIARPAAAMPLPFDLSPPVSSASIPHQLRQHRLADHRRRLSGCTDRDLSISQSRDTSGGVPQFIVQIYNTCINNCAPSDVHVYCGWFASKVVVNPNVFKRIAFNDCLVNGGRPLPRGQILRFTYQNSFMYPLRFRSAKFC